MIDNTKNIDPTASAISLAIVKALNLPNNLSKLTLTFTANSAPVVECHFIAPGGLNSIGEVVSGLACYELVPVVNLANKVA